MRVKIQEAEEESAISYGRIQEIDEGEELETCFICNGQPRLDLAEPSAKVHYCGDVCKALHFPVDKETPWPIIVKYKSQVGRYVIAARDIQPGEIIFSEDAFALGPSHDSLPSCLNCFKLSAPDGYLCPKCQMPVCDEMCSEGETVIQFATIKVLSYIYAVSSSVYWKFNTTSNFQFHLIPNSKAARELDKS